MQVACPVCNTLSGIEFKISEAAILRCPSCRHCFSKPNLSNSIAYDEVYFNDTHENWFNNPNYSLFEKIHQIINDSNIRNTSMIDIGCGNGAFLKYFKKLEKGHILTGIDLAKNDPVEGIEFIQGDFYTYPFKENFDVVVNIATIEHFENVVRFMERLTDICKPGGLVITTTVNEFGMIYRMARLFAHFNLNAPRERLYSQHHLNHFNVSSLRLLLERSGFGILKTLYHNFPLKAVDIGNFPIPINYTIKFSILAVFSLSQIIGKTYLQTVAAINCRQQNNSYKHTK